MKTIFSVLVALFVSCYSNHTALAYEAIPVVPNLPYEAVGIDARIATERSYYGVLQGDPHLYEFAIGEPETLTLQIVQRTETMLPFSIIIVKVKDNDRGVREIGRVSGLGTSTWQLVNDSVLGIPLQVGEQFTAPLEAGVYRVEVSTPENIGKYMLKIGTESSTSGYFSSVAAIYQTQHFFEYSPFRIFLSSYVYYPLGILLLIVLLFYTWRYSKRTRHV